MKPSPEEPRCPFCYNKIEQPKEQLERKLVEYPIGVCSHCSAVYAFDVTGHNMGSAFIEALLFACNEDDYLAFSLSHGQDYSDAVIGNYDIFTHKVMPEKFYHDRYVRGALVFVKLHEQFMEATEEKIRERSKTLQPISHTKLRSVKFSREAVRRYVLEDRREELLELAGEDTRVIHELQKMLYTPDEHLRWRITDIFGEVSCKIGERRPDKISKLLANLLQSAAYPGASAWGALEVIGTIISTNPALYGEFTPQLLSFFQQRNLWREVTWAVGKIATADPGLAKYAFRALVTLLDDEDPVVRGHAAWALGNIGFNDALDKLQSLETDSKTLSIWRDGELREVTVAHLAKEAVEKISR
ncbi:MAG: DVU0298 family protein [Nitrospirota bacterium]